jgi:single-strand DNA-binding protein
MSAENVNVVVVTGQLTRDPELRALGSGTSLCKLRLAVNGRRKDGSTGEWVDKPNYFDVTVWGARGEAAAEHLAKGSPVAIEGRLDWREWEGEGGGKRQTVEIVAEAVQFLDSKASKGALDSEEEPEPVEEPEAEEQPDSEEEARAQAVADEESELGSMSREQLDARARSLGIENPEGLPNDAAVIAEVVVAEVVLDEFDEDELGEEDRPF